MPPVPVPAGLLPFLRQHVGTSRNNSKKGRGVVEWLEDNFGGSWRAGHVTSKKQVYNRVVEQFKFKASNYAYVVTADDAYGVLEKQVDRHAFPGLRNVLFIRRTGNNFQLERWLHWGSSPSATELALFPGATPVLRTPISAPGAGAAPAAPAPTPPDPDIEIGWDDAEAVTDDPSGLAGALRPFRQAIAALKAGKNVILMGPPGTGKTELAVAICEILGVGRDIVTATSDWTTFDTIGGYLPDPSAAQAGGIEPLNFTSGCITRSLEGKRWIVIDELNRADIDKAFGELFTMLSDQIVRLPFKRRRAEGGVGDVVLGDAEHDTDESIGVPEGWRIIGTMNTFDKASLYQMSFAFMRRFAFIDIDPPEQPAYAGLLTAKAQPLAAARNDAFRDACIPALTALFSPPPTASATAPTLTSLGLVVGPAIPLDMISYVESRAKLDAAAEPKTILREAVEMYLLPQFEGQDKKHKKIVEVIKNALGLDGPAEQSIERRLRTWTGYEPRRANP
jgi:5-methylcytosine-specific restriction protein B